MCNKDKYIHIHMYEPERSGTWKSLIVRPYWGFKNCLIPRYGRLLPLESIPS